MHHFDLTIKMDFIQLVGDIEHSRFEFFSLYMREFQKFFNLKKKDEYFIN